MDGAWRLLWGPSVTWLYAEGVEAGMANPVAPDEVNYEKHQQGAADHHRPCDLQADLEVMLIGNLADDVWPEPTGDEKSYENGRFLLGLNSQEEKRGRQKESSGNRDNPPVSKRSLQAIRDVSADQDSQHQCEKGD